MHGVHGCGDASSAWRWQPAAWWGASLGSSVWMLLSGVLLIFKGAWWPGAVAAMSFMLVAAFAAILWTRRARTSARAAIFALVGVLFAAALTTVIAAHAAGALPLLEPRTAGREWVWYALLAGLFGLVLLALRLRDIRAARAPDGL